MKRPEHYKGILLAGGYGSRLYPMTWGVSKQLLPVYDKPMIYYSLALLMQAGVRQVLLISTPEDLYGYQRLLKNGASLGITICYAVQTSPGGIADAFEIGRDFIGNSAVCLVLGDNILYGAGLSPLLNRALTQHEGATIFTHSVKDPRRFGVATFDGDGNVLSLAEKPSRPVSNHAVAGLYLFDADVVEIAASVAPSARGEREIVDVLELYRQQGRLSARVLGQGFTWLDAGTPESLLEAGILVQAMERRQGSKIACLEEIAWRAGWIGDEELLAHATLLGGSPYGLYLHNLWAGSGQVHDSV